MPDINVKVSCDECYDDADVALCQKHHDEQLNKAFEEGKKEGREEELEKE